MQNHQMPSMQIHIRLAVSPIITLILTILSMTALASNDYTDKQLDAFEARVGKTFWARPVNGKSAVFLDAPTAEATNFTPNQNESFEVTDLSGRANKDPYYKVKFASGKVGYIRPEQFHEDLNVTIVTIDPLADAKRRADEQSKDEKGRIEWIQSQPWSAQVKQAAIQKQPTPGLNTAEVKRIMGAPNRITKLHGRVKNQSPEEQWFYPDGTILIFTNGLLSRTEHRSNN